MFHFNSSVFLVLHVCVNVIYCLSCSYSSCHNLSPDKLNIHIVAHTHDDVGWLKTVDEYYSDRVQFILNSIVEELLSDPNRRFIYVEIAFFERWWRLQFPKRKEQVKMLVNEGRLQFTLGHWSMPDEATTYYRDIITNGELGMRFLENEFGECGKPLVAWQIDPFGHSKGIAKIYNSMGFDALFLGRIDYKLLDTLRKSNSTEFSWVLDDKKTQKIDTLINSNVYWPPPNMCWDEHCDDPVIVDDPQLTTYNLETVVDEFVAWVKAQHANGGYQTNNFLVTMGNDFNYAGGNKWFTNLDKLIFYTNLIYPDEFNLVYSTPACYYNAIRNSIQNPLPEYNGDFFPYADFPHAFWTGYYASRPSVKRKVGFGSSVLNSCQQMEVGFGDIVPKGTSDELKRAISVSQHHDAVSGTERQHVAEDYITRLDNGIHICSKAIRFDNFGQLGSQTSVFNPLAWERTEQIQLVDAQTNRPGTKYAITIPPLSTMTLSPDLLKTNTPIPSATNSIRQGSISVEVSHDNIVTVTVGPDTFSFRQTWMYYDANPGVNANSTQASGAYIFRPLGSETPCSVQPPIIQKLDDTELVVTFADAGYVSHSYRIEGDLLVFQYVIGPIPVGGKVQDLPVGKEIISRFLFDELQQDSSTNSFFTDSTNSDFINRAGVVVDEFEPIASTYYPITSQLFLTSGKNPRFCAQLTTGQSIGASAYPRQDGTFPLDLMLHRRLLVDDFRGVTEPLNDTSIAHGRIVLDLSSSPCQSSENDLRRRQIDKRFRGDPIQVIYNSQLPDRQFDILLKALPSNLHLLSLNYDYYVPSSLLVRLESLDNTNPIIINLQDYFNIKNISGVIKVTLAGTLETKLSFTSIASQIIKPLDILTLRITL